MEVRTRETRRRGSDFHPLRIRTGDKDKAKARQANQNVRHKLSDNQVAGDAIPIATELCRVLATTKVVTVLGSGLRPCYQRQSSQNQVPYV